MRFPPLIVLVLLVAALALPADASGPIGPTIGGGTLVTAGHNWTYGGQLVVEGPNTAVPLSGQTVGLYVDGVRVAEGATDGQGRWLARARIPVGTHALHARAFEGSSLEESSPTLTVTSMPTWPAGPALLQGEPGFLYTQANVTWNYPWTDGGYPVLEYKVHRSENGGPFALVYQGNATAFVDPAITPGNDYLYRAVSVTAWGTSNATDKPYNASDTVALVALVNHTVCDDVVCQDVPDGGSFLTNASRNVTFTVHASGVVDTWPVGGPGLANRTVLGKIGSGALLRHFDVGSGPTGSWAQSMGGYSATAPAATGCVSVGVTALARVAGQGHDLDVGGFQVCIP